MKTLQEVLPPMANGRERFGDTPVVWSGKGPIPEIGTCITSHCGIGTVTGYYFADGGNAFYLGIVVELTEPVPWWTKQNRERPAHLFGSEVQAV